MRSVALRSPMVREADPPGCTIPCFPEQIPIQSRPSVTVTPDIDYFSHPPTILVAKMEKKCPSVNICYPMSLASTRDSQRACNSPSAHAIVSQCACNSLSLHVLYLGPKIVKNIFCYFWLDVKIYRGHPLTLISAMGGSLYYHEMQLFPSVHVTLPVCMYSI